MNRLYDVEMMTLSEFYYLRYAQEYKEIDDMHKLHLSAFLTRNATVTKNVGTEKSPKEEYVFKDFKEFFDYEKALKQIDEGIAEPKKEEKPINKRLSPAEIAKQRNSSNGK